MVDIVVNQGNDTLEAMRIAENLLLLKRDKMVAPALEVIEIRN